MAATAIEAGVVGTHRNQIDLEERCRLRGMIEPRFSITRLPVILVVNGALFSVNGLVMPQ